IPSTFTQARTGPDCSTTALRVSPVNSTYRSTPSPSSDRSSREHTSRALPAICRPSISRESITADPRLGTRQRIRPVSISKLSAVCRTDTDGPTFAASPCASTSGAFAVESATVAKPANLIEPSGQYASGQNWSGNCLPFELVNVKFASLVTTPRAKGTPQLTPQASEGAPFSQFSSTG